MTPPTAPSDAASDAGAWRLALILAAGLTLLRVIALFATPLELYPDEAQYWLWSRDLHWGYVSKPPMIALLIRATTLFGDREAWVRLSAPLIHAGAMLALYRVGRRLYGPATGLLAAALYGLMPAVQISSLFIATDAPLMLFLALALWAYAAMIQTPDAVPRRWIAAGLGAALGLAFLSKFAAVYMLIGAAAHALIDRDARSAWGRWAWAAALAALVATFGPNLAWQAAHGFATVSHTAQVNAHWSLGRLFNLGGLTEFLLGQFGVMGPIPFAVLIGGGVELWRRKGVEAADRLLLCVVLPPMVMVTTQAFIARAHAHWAAAGYVAGAVLVAAWLLRWRARGWTIAALALQGAAAALILIVVAAPSLMDATGNGRRLGRVRGWADTAAIISGAAYREDIRGGLSAIAVEDRYLFNELAYYGRAYLASKGSPPLRMRPAAHALDEAELSSPLTPAEGRRVLIAETAGKPPAPGLPGDFATTQPLGRHTVRLDAKHARDIDLWLGVGYRGPPASGRPTPP